MLCWLVLCMYVCYVCMYVCYVNVNVNNIMRLDSWAALSIVPGAWSVSWAD